MYTYNVPHTPPISLLLSHFLTTLMYSSEIISTYTWTHLTHVTYTAVHRRFTPLYYIELSYTPTFHKWSLLNTRITPPSRVLLRSSTRLHFYPTQGYYSQRYYYVVYIQRHSSPHTHVHIHEFLGLPATLSQFIPSYTCTKWPLIPLFQISKGNDPMHMYTYSIRTTNLLVHM